MSISQTRKQRLNIWPVCAAAGPEGGSNPAATFFHVLSILGWWCGKLPRSVKKVYGPEEVSSRIEVCLHRRRCWWGVAGALVVSHILSLHGPRLTDLKLTVSASRTLGVPVCAGTPSCHALLSAYVSSHDIF